LREYAIKETKKSFEQIAVLPRRNHIEPFALGVRLSSEFDHVSRFLISRVRVVTRPSSFIRDDSVGGRNDSLHSIQGTEKIFD
jgi:hypothetical protein